MEGKRQPKRRIVHRVHLVTRTEEQLWIQAYEQLWPRAQRRLVPSTRLRDQDFAVDRATSVLAVGA